MVVLLYHNRLHCNNSTFQQATTTYGAFAITKPVHMAVTPQEMTFLQWSHNSNASRKSEQAAALAHASAFLSDGFANPRCFG
jgi:hypothetical protein